MNNSDSIAQSERQKQLNDIFKSIKEYSEQDTRKLINFCRAKGYSDREIAETLEMSPQAFSQKYSDGENHE